MKHNPDNAIREVMLKIDRDLVTKKFVARHPITLESLGFGYTVNAAAERAIETLEERKGNKHVQINIVTATKIELE